MKLTKINISNRRKIISWIRIKQQEYVLYSELRDGNCWLYELNSNLEAIKGTMNNKGILNEF